MSKKTVNIASRRQAKKVTAEEINYKHIIDSTNNPIGLVDRNFIYRYVNKPYSQAFNKSIDEIIGLSVPDLFGRELFEKSIKPHYAKSFAGENVNYQGWFDFPGWGKRFMDVRYCPFREVEGQVTAVVVNVHDITKLKRIELRLEESEARLNAFMDHYPANIYIKDNNLKHIYGNKYLLDYVGIAHDAWVGTTSHDLFPHDVAESIEKEDRAVLLNKSLRVHEHKRISQDGQQTFLKDIKFPISLETGELLIGGISTDISDIKQAEDLLSEQVKFERLIADIASKLSQSNFEQLDVSFHSTLQTLGSFLKTERAFLARFSANGESFKHTNVWASKGITIPSSLFEVDMAVELPWVTQQIRDGNVINTGMNLTGLPDEAKELRDWLDRAEVNSGVVVPVSVEGNSIGMLGLDTVNQPREYPPAIVDRLKIVADIIGTTLNRVQAEKKIQEQLQFEDLISRLSATFINIKASDVDKNIERGLQLIVEFLKIQRGNLFQFSHEEERLTLTHSYAADGVKTSPRILFSDQQPWFTKKLLGKESFYFTNPSELPKEAEAEKEYLMREGITSALIRPLIIAGKAQGGISLSSLTKERQWPNELLKKMEILGEIFSNALVRKRADNKIEEAFVEIKQLKDRLELENIDLRKEITLRHMHEEIIGQSRAIKDVLQKVEQVSQTDSSVLILGETGTGKELVAKAIHQLSNRKARQMVSINCSALPSTLIESELFGREKGAYTGALSKQAGRFEKADGSTLFLDEIGDLPLDQQAKLLRVLEEGTFERLGGTKTLQTDVRIICATNRDLSEDVAEGRFRQDLYYRLNVFPVTVPPLRERPEDIPVLVWAFVKDFSKSMGKRIESISQNDMEKLQRHPWKGNVRELKNVIEQAMILCTGSKLHIQLPEYSKKAPFAPSSTLKDVERQHILQVLQVTGWRIKGKNGAAELLDIKPTTLHSRMKKLGISRPTR